MADLSPPQHQTAKAAPVKATSTGAAFALWCCRGDRGVGDTIFGCQVTSLKNFCPKDSCARICKSPTVESSGGSSVSLRPLGNDTLTRSIPMDQHADWDAGWVNTWENTRAWKIIIFFVKTRVKGFCLIPSSASLISWAFSYACVPQCAKLGDILKNHLLYFWICLIHIAAGFHQWFYWRTPISI
jgi:hypothetical protein